MKNYLKAAVLALAVAAIGSASAGRNGSGTYTLPAGNPVNPRTQITSTWANNTLSDIAAALSASIAKDGQTVPTANLPMGGFVHTGVGNATARTSYAAAGQVQDFSLQKLGSVLGTNTITGSLAPAITSYVPGMMISFLPANTNTGGSTLAVNGLSSNTIVRANGTNIIAGDLVAGVPALLIHDSASAWYLLNPQASVSGGIATSDIAQLSALNVFTQNQTISKADPRLCFYDSVGDASMFWRWNNDTTRLQIVDGSTCTTTGASSPIRIDSAAGVASLLQFAATTVQINGGTAWHSLNDGSGSGLDADTLDGLSSAAFGQLGNSNVWTSANTVAGLNPASRLNETDAAVDEKLWETQLTAGHWQLCTRTDADASASCAIDVDRTGTAIGPIALASTTLTWNANTLFTTANDGSGSGLDADLLDGSSSAAFATLAGSNTFTNAAPIVLSTTDAEIRKSVDTNRLLLLGGSANNSANGARISIYGNTHATQAGDIILTTGTDAGATIELQDDTNVTGTLAATAVTGNGSGLTSLDAGDISAGTLPVARGGTGTTTSTGTGNVVLSASPTFSGTVTGGTFSGTHTGDGSGLTGLDAGDISAGTLPVARGGTGTTSSTGTGNVVLSASPTLTGTTTAATVAATTVTVGGQSVCLANGTNCPAAIGETSTTATGTVTGCTTAPTTTVRLTKIGSVVFGSIDNFSCTSNALSLTLTGAIPVAYQPARFLRSCTLSVMDNGSTTPGCIEVSAASSTLTLTRGDGSSFNASVSTKGLPVGKDGSFFYHLN